MAMLESGNAVIDAEMKVEKAKEMLAAAERELDEARYQKNRQVTAMLLQSYYLIDDARRLYWENDRLRELLQRTWDVFHDASGKEFDDLKWELSDIGIEV